MKLCGLSLLLLFVVVFILHLIGQDPNKVFASCSITGKFAPQQMFTLLVRIVGFEQMKRSF